MFKDIALHGKGTYYVHCGLGRDRVNIAKRVIESLEPQNHVRLAATSGLKRAEGFETRTTPFQRGRLFQLADGVWMIPMPNDAEFYGYIIQGSPGHVTLLLDPADSVQAKWMDKAQHDMRQYSITFNVLPTSAGGHVVARDPAGRHHSGGAERPRRDEIGRASCRERVYSSV